MDRGAAPGDLAREHRPTCRRVRLYLASLLTSLIKFHRLGTLHLFSSSVAGGSLYSFALVTLITGVYEPLLLWLAAAALIASSAETLVAHLVLSSAVDENMGSIVLAERRRRNQDHPPHRQRQEAALPRSPIRKTRRQQRKSQEQHAHLRCADRERNPRIATPFPRRLSETRKQAAPRSTRASRRTWPRGAPPWLRQTPGPAGSPPPPAGLRRRRAAGPAPTRPRAKSESNRNQRDANCGDGHLKCDGRRKPWRSQAADRPHLGVTAPGVSRPPTHTTTAAAGGATTPTAPAIRSAEILTCTQA